MENTTVINNQTFVVIPRRESEDWDSMVTEDHMKVAEVFRRHVTDIEQIAPYEVPGFPNYPGTSNLIYIPSDLYHTVRSIYHAVQNQDREEFHDAMTRLAGIPANLVSATGYLMGYLMMFKVIPQSLSKLLPFTYAAGAALSIVEGVVHAWSLSRQVVFEKKFDFEFISNLRYMVNGFNPVQTPKAIENMAKLVNKEPESLKELFGDQFDEVKDLFNKMHDELEENPYDADQIIEKYAVPLEEIGRLVTMKNLKVMEEEFLQLNPEEVAEISSKAIQNNKSKTPEEVTDITHSKLKNALLKKKKNFARRVRPWMVAEASETVNPILSGTIKGNSEAIKEGIRLTDDIHTQSNKKKLAHVLGIIALGFAVVSLICMAASCPASIPWILIGVATVFAVASFVVTTGYVDQVGWHFNGQKFLPDFICNRFFQPYEEKKKQEKFRQKKINPLNHEYMRVHPRWDLDPKKMKATLPSLSPFQEPLKSPQLHHGGHSNAPSHSSRRWSSLQEMSPPPESQKGQPLFV